MLQKCSIWKTAGIFFKEPTKQHYLLEISRKTKKAHTSVKSHLKTLKELRIIKEEIEKKGSRKFPLYKANIESEEYRSYKRLYNLAELTESKLINYLKNKLMPKTIVLFGSYQKGGDTEDSDIDIFLECKKEEIDISKFNFRLGRKIQLHFKDSFKKYPKELKNNIANGIVLHGYLEVF